jgi:hypothetical protein
MKFAAKTVKQNYTTMCTKQFQEAVTLVKMSLYAPTNAETPQMCQRVNAACEAIGLTQRQVGEVVLREETHRLEYHNSLYFLMAGGRL